MGGCVCVCARPAPVLFVSFEAKTFDRMCVCASSGGRVMS